MTKGELTKKEVTITKGIAILFMLLLHLFETKKYQGLFTPIVFINEIPLIYYLALFADCCVPIYCFCSGYGLFVSYKKDKENFVKKNMVRLKKLYINYLVIFFLFVIILGNLLNRRDYIGGLKEILLTVTTIYPNNHNGAWWFFFSYFILMLLAPFINRWIEKKNNYTIFIISFIFYFITYIQRVRNVIVVDNYFVGLFIRQIALFGTVQIPFIIGAIFANKKLYSKIKEYICKFKFKNMICLGIIFFMIIVHGIIESSFISVFTGVTFIVVFNIIEKPTWLNRFFMYMSKHSTNIWLTHMFFYIIYFRDFIYSFQYSILIFIALLTVSLISSIFINFIMKNLSIIIKTNIKRLP